ncbi:demethylmenaquinone methyltransferase [Kocuria palustris]|uniref:demethylmenaquinone methyltransferase n=1 Tax=Kocuria palustris TaxID=71999 RepID=UPI0011A2191E|nr:demethylmenaquinone methyltransferase [Kocuria palustris]
MNRADLSKRTDAVASMFDEVAPRYDLANDILALGQTRGWRRAVTAAVGAAPGEKVLDVAAGTGTSSEPFMEAGATVVAADLSEGMLRVGRERHPRIDFVQADATRLPFADETFDAVTISFGLRNIAEFRQALLEMLRVAKPGGRLVICEFSTPTFGPFRKVYSEYLVRAIPGIAQKVTSNPEAYEYLAESIRAWPDQEQLAAHLAEVGWQDVRYRNLTGGIVALHRAVKPAEPARGVPSIDLA